MRHVKVGVVQMCCTYSKYTPGAVDSLGMVGICPNHFFSNSCALNFFVFCKEYITQPGKSFIVSSLPEPQTTDADEIFFQQYPKFFD